jgi:hypothetical protein
VHPEPVVVVADDHERMTSLVGITRSPLDARRDIGHEQSVPADVDISRCEQGVALGERELEAVDVIVDDASIREQRPVASVEHP